MVRQTPWIERKFNFDFPAGLFPVILERLRGTLPRLRDILEKRKEEELIITTGGWSPKEIVGHLSDLEELWDQRITDFLGRKDVLTAADMSNRKTHEAGHRETSIDILLSDFGAKRARLITRVLHLDEHQVSVVSLHPRLQTPMRLIDSLFFTAEHDDHELTKLRQLLG